MVTTNYHYRGTTIHYNPNQQYGFYSSDKFIELNVAPYLRKLSAAKEHPGKRLKTTLNFLVEKGNEPTKELASHMLEQLF